ncbi:MAG: hypothetical protein ACFFEO_07215 [Candidatus Thorarchaeota archaeon]
MKLELQDLNNGSVSIGDKLNVRTNFKFEEDTSILWAGIKLITQPPCVKELQISKEEIFSKGHFEAGEYTRERSLLIKTNVVPTIKNRNLEYELKLIVRQPHPTDPDDDLVINRTKKVEIRSRDSVAQRKQSNPISFSISGLNVLLSKDLFKPGETIKVSFSSDVLKHIEVRLLQKSNLVCFCDTYGQKCRKVEELPPAIAGDAKTSDIEKGFLLLKVPEIAEPSHNYLWEPTEKEYWGFKFGDYTQYSLLIIGKRKFEYGREPISFELPITIVSKPTGDNKKEIDLFSGTPSAAPTLFDGISSKFQKTYKVVSIDSDLEKYKVKIKNISKENLKGVTVRISGLQEGLFETAPNLTGFNIWKINEEKEVIFRTKQDISALISILEDNSQKLIRLQSPVSSGFF